MLARRIAAVAVVLAVVAAPLLAADAVPLNTATAEQLTALGITPSQAAQIIRYRKENGNFLQVEELLVVPQISREVFEKLRGKVSVDE
jgi:competence ComEA-like helix-hairpin-helix protein